MVSAFIQNVLKDSRMIQDAHSNPPTMCITSYAPTTGGNCAKRVGPRALMCAAALMSLAATCAAQDSGQFLYTLKDGRQFRGLYSPQDHMMIIPSPHGGMMAYMEPDQIISAVPVDQATVVTDWTAQRRMDEEGARSPQAPRVAHGPPLVSSRPPVVVPAADAVPAQGQIDAYRAETERWRAWQAVEIARLYAPYEVTDMNGTHMEYPARP